MSFEATELLAKLQRETALWATVEIHGKETRHTDTNETSRFITTLTCKYIQNADGNRYYEKQFATGDGRSVAEFLFKQGKSFSRARVDLLSNTYITPLMNTSGFGEESSPHFRRTNTPEPLQHLFVGRSPLHAALRTATIVGKSEVLQRPCVIFKLEDVQFAREAHAYYVHLDTVSAMPLKCVYGDNPNEPFSQWIAEEIIAVQGRTVVTKSSYVRWNVVNGVRSERRTSHFVDKILFDKKYSTATFASDRLKVSGFVEPARIDNKANVVSSITVNGDALQPSTYTSMISIFTFTLGVVICGVAILQKRKNA